MRTLFFYGLTSLTILGTAFAEEEFSTPSVQQNETQPQKSTASTLQPFTGSISGSRVRLRLQPTLDSVVLKEFSPRDLVQVVGESDDFYAILPESCHKGYIFRTYILDNSVEGSNVNVRLKPDTGAPVIVQLQQGDKVTGKPCKENSKWLEIELPPSVRFYVAKEFVVKEGPLSIYTERTKLKQDLLDQIQSLNKKITLEFAKPFNEIDPSSIKKELEDILNKAKTDMPEVAKKASWLIRKVEQEYLRLKIQTNTTPPAQEPKQEQPQVTPTPVKNPSISFSLKEQEQQYIQSKLDSKEVATTDELYALEQKTPVLLKGKIVPFERSLKIKPGDFMLIHPVTKVPVAYLYSTQVDLEPLVGTMVAIEAGERPNHDFALPAYFVYVATPIQK